MEKQRFKYKIFGVNGCQFLRWAWNSDYFLHEPLSFAQWYLVRDYVSVFFTRLWSVRTAMLFRYKGDKLVTKNIIDSEILL